MNEIRPKPCPFTAMLRCFPRSRSYGYAPSSRLAWRRNGGGLTVNNLVHGALGRQLAAADFAGQAGVQRFELRSAHWPPGTYWVSVIVDGHREVRLVEKF
jgi:hypothetical protein